ncbi:TonB-dependent receptor domain-containing protein [Foetidibacter luteolus]|uniref:TonB-dependent receptor domain-containing protein n=1 Tax=Foetidibacter luteolus TaxID=2608880 RepID=UPI00129A82F9|nr:TonB-dependent receptor [Foetidibacter luteolus]
MLPRQKKLLCIKPVAVVIALFCFYTSTATPVDKATLKGKVADSVSQAPLASVSVQVFNSADKKLVEGNISSENGEFNIELPYGTYYAQVDFMGYQSWKSKTFTLSKDKPLHNMGLVQLTTSSAALTEVVVQAEKSTMQLSLDKKIFNVGKDLANAGGTASDILTNIPSVSVDPEGNIKLRGSDNVRILIDGKPSGLVSFKGGSGLQQLQASMIDRVEIITNPSARYEAEGMAGIINIVLKKDKRQGFNGSFELITGNPANFGAAANINYRHNKLNFFINYGIAYRRQPNVGNLYQEVYGKDTTFILKQNNSGTVRGFNNNIRGGLDYYFTEKSILTASYLFRRSDANRITDIRYEDYLFNLNNPTGVSTRRQDENEEEPNSEYSLIYKRTFTRSGHELVAEVKYLDNWESSDQLFTQQFLKPDGTQQPEKNIVQHSVNDESEKQLLFQVDYVQPIGKDGKFETGLRSSSRDMVNDFVVNQKNADGSYTPLPGLDNVFLYDENIHAAYGILGNKTGKVSYQAGLRAEWTAVTTTLQETHQVNPRKYANLFPSAHLTFDLPKENAIQLSYSRRIRRPFYNDLSPFFTFSDSRNFFSGNPDLNPEFSNVFEVGHIKYFDKGTFTSAVYYRNTTGKIDQIRTVDNEGNSITKPQNLSSEKAYGIELTSAYSPYKWWKLDFNANFFHADIDGSNIVKDYKASTYSWFLRQTSRFSLAKNFDIQLRGNYEAPQKTAQGSRKALIYMDVAISKDVFKGNGTLNLNVLDVFNSRRFRYITNGPNFYTNGNSQYRRRQVNLTLNYRLKQAKPPAKPKKLDGSDESF